MDRQESKNKESKQGMRHGSGIARHVLTKYGSISIEIVNNVHLRPDGFWKGELESKEGFNDLKSCPDKWPSNHAPYF
jgi:hypothetical protein